MVVSQTTWILGDKFGPSARAVGVLNYLAISSSVLNLHTSSKSAPNSHVKTRVQRWCLVIPPPHSLYRVLRAELKEASLNPWALLVMSRYHFLERVPLPVVATHWKVPMGWSGHRPQEPSCLSQRWLNTLPFSGSVFLCWSRSLSRISVLHIPAVRKIYCHHMGCYQHAFYCLRFAFVFVPFGCYVLRQSLTL